MLNFSCNNDRIATNSAIGKAMFRMLAGLQAVRKRGHVGGRSRVDGKAVEKARKLYDSKEYSVAEITEMTGVSKATLYRRLKERGS